MTENVILHVQIQAGGTELPTLIRSGSIIIGDRGYVSKKLVDKLKEQGLTLLALKRSNAKQQYEPQLRKLIFKTRRRIETTFSQLTEQFNVERVLSKTFIGLSLRVLTKIFAFNLSLMLTQSNRIKSLLF